MSNLSYLFHTEYFQKIFDLDPGYLDINERLINQRFTCSNDILEFTDESKGYQSFVLSTTYPGLLVGLGYPHSPGDAATKTDDAIKLGFSFDYVTGLPVLPGSTIKGILRSSFRIEGGKKYLASVLNDVGDFDNGDSDSLTESIEKEIFGAWCHDATTTIPGNDIFFDAVPVRGDSQGLMLNIENITPHLKPAKEKADDHEKKLYGAGMKNPRPLKLLKVRPGVYILFRFKLHDGKLSKEQKCNLFKTLLLDLGVGAKTNVGFGGMELTPDDFRFPYYELEPYDA